MRLFTAIVASLALFSAAAFGEGVVSIKYGFSAEFPMAPSFSEPQGAETDANGKTISNTVMIQDAMPGSYTAMVTVDSYIVPIKIDAPSTLQAMTKGFVAQLDARTTSSKPGQFDGKPARFFAYDTADHSVAGNGMIVLVPSKKPRIYLVITSHTPMASADQIAALDKFIKSFQFE